MDINSYKMNTKIIGSYENKEIDLLSKIFFSSKNINIIQNKIINLVKKKYNYVITEQSKEILSNVMSVIYYNNVNHNYKNNEDVKNEIKRLNNLVIKQCVKDIKKNIDEYVRFLDKTNNDFCLEQIEPWNIQGQNVSKKGNNTFKFKNYQIS